MRNYKHKTFIFVLLGILFLHHFTAFNIFSQHPPRKFSNSQDYVNIVKYYRYLNPDSALFYVSQGLEKARQQDDQIGVASLLNQYGMIEDNFARYRESRLKYLEAEEIYRHVGDKVGLATILIRLGVVERRKGNHSKAFEYALQALKISEQNNHILGMLEGRVVLAETFYDLADYKKALKHLEIAEQLEKQAPLTNLSLNMYDDFGSVYVKLKDGEKAIHYIQKGLAKSNKVEYNGLKISLLKTLARAYDLKGDHKTAKRTLKEALAFSRQIKNVLREHAILTELANMYEKQQPDTALKYLEQAFNIVAKYKMYRQEIILLNKISALYKSKGNLVKALEAKQTSSNVAEEVFYKDMMKQVFSLESAYELEKSKVKLNELIIKNRGQQALNNIILSIAIGVFLILIVTLIYYLRSRRLNKLLTNANKGLEESNEVKDKLLSIIAHDIRSPLVSTVGIMKLIGDKELDEQTQQDMVNKLVVHCDNSLDILDKLLKWGQMQIKGVHLNTSVFDPVPNIHRNIALLQEAADKKHINIILDVPLNVMLEADPDHFDFIIRNLLANAIKFTGNNGTIRLEAKIEGSGIFRFSVIDNGVGISENRIKNLFKLTSISTKGTSSEEGTSLGLIICKDFVTANNGKLYVESKEGLGTTFSFTLKGFIAKNL